MLVPSWRAARGLEVMCLNKVPRGANRDVHFARYRGFGKEREAIAAACFASTRSWARQPIAVNALAASRRPVNVIIYSAVDSI